MRRVTPLTPISLAELREMSAARFGDLVKAVVDLERHHMVAEEVPGAYSWKRIQLLHPLQHRLNLGAIGPNHVTVLPKRLGGLPRASK